MKQNNENKGPQHIKDHLKAFIRKTAKPPGLINQIKSNWVEIMGKYTSFTTPIQYKSNVLFVRTSSAPVFHELTSFETTNIENRIFNTTNKKISVKFILHD
ncbi:MAG: DUF721 domain-containing protein [Planctomycetes bacterium]|nr:DUF721 domain-containing protein [Planctomycetota bacterium]